VKSVNIGGIVRAEKGVLYEIGGIADHERNIFEREAPDA
jgi:hypothetical protein